MKILSRTFGVGLKLFRISSIMQYSATIRRDRAAAEWGFLPGLPTNEGKEST